MNGSVMFVEIVGLSITEGTPALTVMVSPIFSGLITASTRDVCERRRLLARLTDFIPANVRTITYWPGGRVEKLYAPLSPVTAVRVPCNAGEEIVTTTPGNARPSADTTPVSAALV
jgi:hypothetical protein